LQANFKTLGSTSNPSFRCLVKGSPCLLSISIRPMGYNNNTKSGSSGPQECSQLCNRHRSKSSITPRHTLSKSSIFKLARSNSMTPSFKCSWLNSTKGARQCRMLQQELERNRRVKRGAGNLLLTFRLRSIISTTTRSIILGSSLGDRCQGILFPHNNKTSRSNFSSSSSTQFLWVCKRMQQDQIKKALPHPRVQVLAYLAGAVLALASLSLTYLKNQMVEVVGGPSLVQASLGLGLTSEAMKALCRTRL
jgi:hypothetical protein